MPQRQPELTVRPVVQEHLGFLNRYSAIGRNALRKSSANIPYVEYVANALKLLIGGAAEFRTDVKVERIGANAPAYITCVGLRHLTGDVPGAAALAAIQPDDFRKQFIKARPKTAQHTRRLEVLGGLSLLHPFYEAENKRLIGVEVFSRQLVEDSEWAVAQIQAMTTPDINITTKDEFFLPFGKVTGMPEAIADFAVVVLPRTNVDSSLLPDAVTVSSLQCGNYQMPRYLSYK